MQKLSQVWLSWKWNKTSFKSPRVRMQWHTCSNIPSPGVGYWLKK